jgi:O6-methylguanine-DNA--protein-cysteine methyltransferase
MRLSPLQAQQVLQYLIHERRISQAEIGRYREIQQLEERLQSLRAGGGGAVQATTQRGGRKRRRSSSITGEQLASRQLQGRYLALIRQIPARKRAQYAKTAKERGREAAIRDMQSAVGSGKPRARRARRLTSEQRASRQLQGRYLGLVRQIPASQRSRYAKIAKERGREAAIKEMQGTLSK